MPKLWENPDFDWQMFYGAYVRTYIERDVRELSEIGDTVKFMRFMVAPAASTGQLVLSVEALFQQYYEAGSKKPKAVFS